MELIYQNQNQIGYIHSKIQNDTFQAAQLEQLFLTIILYRKDQSRKMEIRPKEKILDLSRFRYDHPRGKFKCYFDNIKFSTSDEQASELWFDGLTKRINSLNIPSEWKSKFNKDNIVKRLERILDKKLLGYKEIKDIPAHEIIEYAEVLLRNYYEDEENMPYEDCKKLLKQIKSEVSKEIGIIRLKEKLGIGDYFVQMVDDQVELIYNLGDGYVATLPLQKKKIEAVLEEPPTVPVEEEPRKEQRPVKDISLNDSMELDEFARTVVEDWVNDRFQRYLKQDLSQEEIEFLIDFYKRGFIDGHNSIIPNLRYAPLPEFIYYTPKTMNIDVKKFIDKAIVGFEDYNKKFKKSNKEMTSEQFAGIVKQALVEQDKEELSKALRS